MAKVTITIEDMDTGVDVQLRFENPNRITQMPSAENTLAQNLAVSRQYLHPDHADAATPAEAPLERVLDAMYATTAALRQQLDPQMLIQDRKSNV